MTKEPTLKNLNSESVDLETVLDHIMTAEAYSRIQHETPCVFSMEGEGKELYYFGSPHSSDPEDPLFSDIEHAFSEFNPDVVFIEGLSVSGDVKQFNEKIKAASREEVINWMGEPSFTLKLAVEKGIAWQSLEPIDRDLYNHLLEQGFSKDELFAWNVFLILPQYHRQMNKQGFKEYVAQFIEIFRRNTNWKQFDYSYEHALQIGEQILGETIDIENESSADDFTDPIPWEEKKDSQTVLNRIGQAASIYRDRHIVSDIAEALKTNKKVFVVYGASHAVMQEPALRKLFESTR